MNLENFEGHCRLCLAKNPGQPTSMGNSLENVFMDPEWHYKHPELLLVSDLIMICAPNFIVWNKFNQPNARLM